MHSFFKKKDLCFASSNNEASVVSLMRRVLLVINHVPQTVICSTLPLCLTGIMQNLLTSSPLLNLSDYTSISSLLLVS
jgi:hypothetical protein